MHTKKNWKDVYQNSQRSSLPTRITCDFNCFLFAYLCVLNFLQYTCIMTAIRKQLFLRNATRISSMTSVVHVQITCIFTLHYLM